MTYRNGGSSAVANMIVADVEMDKVYKRLEDISQRNHPTVSQVVVRNIYPCHRRQMPPQNGVDRDDIHLPVYAPVNKVQGARNRKDALLLEVCMRRKLDGRKAHKVE